MTGNPSRVTYSKIDGCRPAHRAADMKIWEAINVSDAYKKNSTSLYYVKEIVGGASRTGPPRRPGTTVRPQYTGVAHDQFHGLLACPAALAVQDFCSASVSFMRYSVLFFSKMSVGNRPF